MRNSYWLICCRRPRHVGQIRGFYAPLESWLAFPVSALIMTPGQGLLPGDRGQRWEPPAFLTRNLLPRLRHMTEAPQSGALRFGQIDADVKPHPENQDSCQTPLAYPKSLLEEPGVQFHCVPQSALALGQRHRCSPTQTMHKRLGCGASAGLTAQSGIPTKVLFDDEPARAPIQKLTIENPYEKGYAEKCARKVKQVHALTCTWSLTTNVSKTFPTLMGDGRNYHNLAPPAFGQTPIGRP